LEFAKSKKKENKIYTIVAIVCSAYGEYIIDNAEPIEK
jgi:hypothetical protein